MTKGQLTGYQRQVADIVADFYNAIQKWSQINSEGFQEISEISNVKLSILSEKISSDILTKRKHKNLHELTEKFSQTFSSMEKLSDKLSSLTEKLKLLSTAYYLSFDQQETIFDSLTFDDFINNTSTISLMYNKECSLKKELTSTIGLLEVYTNKKDFEFENYRDVFMTYSACWINEPYIDEKYSEQLLENMLIETGHRII